MKIVHERGVEANLNFYFYFDLLIQTSDRKEPGNLQNKIGINRHKNTTNHHSGAFI